MDTITSYLSSDHERCDNLFADAETLVDQAKWEDAAARLKEFAEALERHFAMEEQILFQAFEKATGNSAGPTAVMRMEHQQIRAILQRLHEASAARDAESFLGFSETLNTMMQQHNMKEESILYVMTDRVLSTQREDIIGAMDAVGVTA